MCLQEEAEYLKPLFDKYIDSTLSFKNSSCKELIPVTELNGVISLCRLYDALTTSDNGVRETHLTVLIVITTTAALIIA